MFAHAVSLLLLAFAVSLDGFGVGVTYGLRRIRIPVVSVVIIALCSGVVVWLSMQIGSLLTGYMSVSVSKLIGACLLMLIGCWALFQLWRRRYERDSAADGDPDSTFGDSGAAAGHESEWMDAGSGHPGVSADLSAAVRPVIVLEWKRLGLVIQILRKPQIADVDRSGIISASEAVLLGFALSIDSFGAGLGAAMVGFSPLLTAFTISTASGLLLLAGMRLGFRFAAWRGMRALSVLPGIMLIIMGLLRLM